MLAAALASIALSSPNTYTLNGLQLTFRKKAAAEGHESDPPLLLVHPVGIGLSSWFWDRFFDEWEYGEIYAPDLIGCGGSKGPSWRALSALEDWSAGCEELWRQHMDERPCVVVAQGGLAPVGVRLSHWCGQDKAIVAGLVLTSPPTWGDMTSAVPAAELERNLRALSTPLGSAAVGLLENHGAIRFFSDLFLFEEKSDEEWLEKACAGCGAAVRPPVIAFNAGVLQARSYEVPLRTMGTPTLVVSGRSDKRESDRQAYAAEMRACELATLPGCNVLPWESAKETAGAIADFIQRRVAA
jgi:pimeloyl-ACP methyl ester carboxylesterase